MNFGNRPFVYGDGRSHREAADLVELEESCEEKATLFAVLPFSIVESEPEQPSAKELEEEEEEERKRDEGVVLELAQTGPHTRKLKPPIVTIGEWPPSFCPRPSHP